MKEDTPCKAVFSAAALAGLATFGLMVSNCVNQRQMGVQPLSSDQREINKLKYQGHGANVGPLIAIMGHTAQWEAEQRRAQKTQSPAPKPR